MIGPLPVGSVVAGLKNPTIRKLLGAVQKYNMLLPHMRAMRTADKNFLLDARMVGYLDEISLLVLAYLLHKPPGARKVRGQTKWADVLTLKDAITSHADFFGIRFMKGDFVFKEDGWNYWLERSNTSNIGKHVYDDYVTWVRSKGSKAAYSYDGESNLEYFDELRRAKYEVHYEKGRFLWTDGTPLSTDEGAAAYSSLQGVYIYVCSARTKKIYTAPSEDSVVHHSSFLSGEPVIAAGDWMVNDGIVAYINAASGHYRPTPDNMQLFAATYRQCWQPLPEVPPRKNGKPRTAVIQARHKGKMMYIDDFAKVGQAAAAVEPDWRDEVAGVLQIDPVELTKNG